MLYLGTSYNQSSALEPMFTWVRLLKHINNRADCLWFSEAQVKTKGVYSTQLSPCQLHLRWGKFSLIYSAFWTLSTLSFVSSLASALIFLFSVSVHLLIPYKHHRQSGVLTFGFLRYFPINDLFYNYAASLRASDSISCHYLYGMHKTFHTWDSCCPNMETVLC